MIARQKARYVIGQLNTGIAVSNKDQAKKHFLVAYGALSSLGTGLTIRSSLVKESYQMPKYS